MTSTVLYKEPDDTTCVKLIQEEEPDTLHSLEQLDGRSGFVIAPFTVSDNRPIVLLRNCNTQTFRLEKNTPEQATPTSSANYLADRNTYHADFQTFHNQLRLGHFDKLVLSRSVSLPTSRRLPLETLFTHACRLYPHLYVACFSTPVTGTWLMATPELLLGRSPHFWHTMALAGTMKHGAGKWSEKNILEQQHVVEYIRSCLKEHATHITERGPYSVRAAHLQHLRTDFNFKLKNPNRLGTLLSSLHPTPAVCGLPKEEAKAFITANEHNNREYYSGFAGTISSTGPTSLHVSLRCMKITPHAATLFAGGGLVPQSDEESEWRETESKLQTMSRLISTAE